MGHLLGISTCIHGWEWNTAILHIQIRLVGEIDLTSGTRWNGLREANFIVYRRQ